MNVTGLFFGSFDPIHNGHLAIANYLLDEDYCQKIWFVVSPQNPWKKDRILLEEQKRLQIVRAAIGGDPRLEACDAEFKLPKPSYTYQTLKLLSRKYPQEKFALIIGGDNWLNFHKWKHFREIQEQYRILAYPRPHIEIPPPTSKNIVLVHAPLTEISSTQVRQRIREQKDISDIVPAPALPLILKYYVVL